ncbi:Gas vesicle synthesis family protein [Streptomyces violaceusniger Tu 4113]|uniref:Gas vesicle synthesis family protein n=2 Tax=Streptomyces violaceusniger TaxID=68280 RepID=G2PAE0_STRV4|nr:Gas vesicle synthesis family protein [Streptomyces violaceusniger Tu 4113]
MITLIHMAEGKPHPSSTKTSPRSRPPRPAEAARYACEQLASLIVHEPEGVSGVTRDEDGWVVSVDVLEVARIPDTTSLLATYEVRVDQRGELQEYRRVRRYRRGAADDC